MFGVPGPESELRTGQSKLSSSQLGPTGNGSGAFRSSGPTADWGAREVPVKAFGMMVARDGS
jgi:hypothetical protein